MLACSTGFGAVIGAYKYSRLPAHVREIRSTGFTYDEDEDEDSFDGTRSFREGFRPGPFIWCIGVGGFLGLIAIPSIFMFEGPGVAVWGISTYIWHQATK